MNKALNDNIQDVDFSEALSERYLAYALSSIMGRSLPDERDGLKPVHRRILFAMHQLKLDPKSGYKKCARIVGDVIGKYHPHGDVAVYDTLVRLAQSFSLRYPLIDGQGNFGSIDGDGAAAMRYTESRLTDIALYLLEELQQDTVDFRMTYDGQESEPMVLPAAFPNLLANGTEGIAVGMATSVPPHNLDELCEAIVAIINEPEITTAQLVKIIHGPDFPTGGILIDNLTSIIAAYESGKGSFRIRAKWNQENLAHGIYQIVITEIPYQVQKSKLIEKIADLLRDKKLPLLDNIRDESAEDIRVILEPKNRNIQPEILMETLFKLTDLETRFNMNMNVLEANSTPKLMGIKEVLSHFINHRLVIIERRSNNRLEQINHRLEVLGGLIVAYLNIDEVIEIIRYADDPKQELIQKYSLTDVQAESILNIRLRSLRKLEEIAIRKEQTELEEEKSNLVKLLDSKQLKHKTIIKELGEIKKRFGKNTEIGKRRTIINPVASVITNIDVEAFIEKEPITIILSKMNWIKSVKGHNVQQDDIKFKEGDELSFILKVSTTDKILFTSDSGKFFTISADKISRGKGFGEPLQLIIEYGNDKITHMMIYEPEEKLLLVASNAKGFVVEQSNIVAQTKNGKQILDAKDDAKLVFCEKITGDHIAVIGENRKMLVFSLTEIPIMRRGQGLTLQKYKQGSLSDIKIFDINKGLSWQNKSKKYNITNLTEWAGHRGQTGRMAPVGFPHNNKFGE
jgi:topoisomerase IV subunit A